MSNNKEWFDDEGFWETYSPVMFDDKRWAEVGEAAGSITRLAALKPESGSSLKVLDLCCGLGRISSELARRGFVVTGVDLSASLLETAREDAAYEALNIEYVQCDARSFKRPDFFDAAVNLYISFGYFENPADDLLAAKNVYESLKAGGSFIVETLGKEIAVRDFTPGEWFERGGYTVLTEYQAVDSWSGLKNRWILIKENSAASSSEKLPFRIEKTFTQRLYSAAELRALLFEAGFAAVEIYGGWDERAYDQNAQTLILVGRKLR